MNSTALLRRSFAALLAAIALVPAARAQTVGTTSAVNPASTGGGRTLVLGAQVIHNERISTNANGSVQLLFIDRTTMSIGPDSDVVIDEYVYDPNKGAGKIAVTLGKGLMRFVGGQVTHSNEATVQTSNAVIGIRGGTGQFAISAQGTQAIFLGGNSTNAGLTVTPCTPPSGTRRGSLYTCTAAAGGGVAQTITTPGFGTMVGDGALSAPAVVEAATLAAQNTALTSRPGTGQSGGGGAGTAAAVVRVASTQAAAVASGTIGPNTTPIAGLIANAAAQVSALASVSTIVNNAILSAQTVNQQTAAQQAVTQQIQQIVPNLNTATLPFALNMTNCCEPANPTSPVPYLPGQFAFGGNFISTPVLGFLQGSGSVATLQYGFNFSSSGDVTTQQSWFYVATGAVTNGGTSGPVYFGNFVGTQRPGPAFSQGTASGTFSGNSSGLQISAATGLPTAGTVNQNRFDPASNTFTNQSASFSLGQTGAPSSAQSYAFTQTFSPLAAPSDLGLNRPTFTSAGSNGVLSGYASGLMQTVVGGSSLTAPYVVNNQNGLPTDVSIQLDPTTSRMQANFNLQSRNPPSSAITNAAYQFGSLANNDGRSAYIDYDRFGAVAAVDPATGNPLSTIDGLAITNHSAAIVAVRSADAAQIAAVVSHGSPATFCECDFTRWGLWSTASDQFSFTDMGHAMFWVAGQLPQASQVPTIGTATYTGHAIANIANGANQYVTAGNFSNTVNFGATQNQMQISVSNFDNGDNYAGSGSISASDRRNFSASLTSTANRTMTLGGSFFKGASGPVGEMGGQLAVSGTNYTGAGIFAAKSNGVH